MTDENNDDFPNPMPPKGKGIVIDITKEQRLALPKKVTDVFKVTNQDNDEDYMAYESDTDRWHPAFWGGLGTGDWQFIRVDTPDNRSGLIIYRMEKQPDGTFYPVERIEGDFLIVWS